MTGRLTLSRADKGKAMLSHGETGYEWVEREDPRVREVRLLDEVGRVSVFAPETNIQDSTDWTALVRMTTSAALGA